MPVTRTSLTSPSTPDATPQPPRLTWTSPDGSTVITLSDFGGNPWGVTTLSGATGFGMPDFTYYETASPSFDGSLVRGVRAGARDINLPLLLWGSNRAQCLENFHGLLSALNPRNGMGTLTVAPADGSPARSIGAYYNGGFAGQDDDQAWGMSHMTAVLALRCPQPFFLGDPTVTTLQIAYGDTFFPVLPVQLVANQILGNTTLINDGDADAFPIYTITGPVANPSITNITNGTYIRFTTTLSAGDSITIDTREGVKTVTKNGTNFYSSLLSGSTLAPLQPGANQMTFTMANATIDTQTTITFQKRYLTAY